MKISLIIKESSVEIPSNTKIELPYDTVVPLLGIYPKECKSGYNKDTCTPMFTAALFTIAKLCRQHKCSTTDEQIKKMWYYCLCIYLYKLYRYL
jgi:hypothetical protein